MDCTDLKPQVIVIAGPTAVGKTKTSISLCKKINGQVISADSMQVYRKMDIGSAKITEHEMQGIPHHLIDVLEPTDSFDVTVFQKLAKDAMQTIYRQSSIPVLVGGTGFYIQALLRDIDFTDCASDVMAREKWEIFGKEFGANALHERLREVDPKSAEQIPAGNMKRVVRALEYYDATGEQISVHNAREAAKPSAFRFAYFVLTDDRAKLYARIDKRVDEMMEQGFLAEVEYLRSLGLNSSSVSMQGLGYKQLLQYMEGRFSFAEAVDEIKLQTRHFAKRQLTWFRREKDCIWIHKGEFDYDDEAILQFMLHKIEEKGIVPSNE